MVPIGAQLARVFTPPQFAVVFVMIWGSYMVTDALAEIGGSIFGKQNDPRAGHRRREPQVDRRGRLRSGGVLDSLCRDCRRERSARARGLLWL